MSSSSLESEDLEIVPFVRMEDVQPSRDRILERSSPPQNVEDVIFETCIIENLEYENECVVNDDDGSNIGSMVSIHSEESPESETAELIIPDVIEIEIPNTHHVHHESQKQTVETQTKPIDNQYHDPGQRWPTLEILPGGFINNYDKCEVETTDIDELSNEKMVYACAKCSQRFKHLFSLMKHVRCHEEQERRLRKSMILAKVPKCKTIEKKCTQRKRTEKLMLPVPQSKIRKLPKRIKSKS